MPLPQSPIDTAPGGRGGRAHYVSTFLAHEFFRSGTRCQPPPRSILGRLQQLLYGQQGLKDRHLQDDLPVLFPVATEDRYRSQPVFPKRLAVLGVAALDHLQEAGPLRCRDPPSDPLRRRRIRHPWRRGRSQEVVRCHMFQDREPAALSREPTVNFTPEWAAWRRLKGRCYLPCDQRASRPGAAQCA